MLVLKDFESWVLLPLVAVPPQIEGNSLMFGVQEEKLRINGSLTLSCLTKGFPEPNVQWFKDGQVGSRSDRKLIISRARSPSCGRQRELQQLQLRPNVPPSSDLMP